MGAAPKTVGFRDDPEDGLRDLFRNESDALTTPLLSESMRTSDSEYTDDDWDVDEDEDTPMTIDLPLLLTSLLVAGGMVTSAAAAVYAASVATSAAAAVYVASAICFVTSPWVAVKQVKINKDSGIRARTNELRDAVELLKEEEQILSAAITDLQEEVDCLCDIQKELQEMVSEQGYNTDQAVSLVNENELVLKKMRVYLRQGAMAEIARIVIRSDTNGDMTINLKELKKLTLRVKISLSERGVDLDEALFMAMVRKDNDISTILKVIAAIMFEDELIDGMGFEQYAEEARMEEQRQNELTGSLRAAGAMSRFRRIASGASATSKATQEAEKDEMLQGDLAGSLLAARALSRLHRIASCATAESNDGRATQMFTLQDRYTKGSVDVARGTRVTLAGQKAQASRATAVIGRQTLTLINESPVVQQAFERKNSQEAQKAVERKNSREAQKALERKNSRDAAPVRPPLERGLPLGGF